jgi:hypothetical protein
VWQQLRGEYLDVLESKGGQNVELGGLDPHNTLLV